MVVTSNLALISIFITASAPIFYLSQVLANYIFFGLISFDINQNINKTLNLPIIGLDKDPHYLYIIEHDLHRDSFSQLAKQVKSNKLLVQAYNLATPLLTTLLVGALALTFWAGPIQSIGVALSALLTASIGASRYLRKQYICIDDSAHRELMETAEKPDEVKINVLLKKPISHQNIHHNNYEIVRLAIDLKRFQILRSLIKADNTATVLKKAFAYACSDDEHDRVAKFLSAHLGMNSEKLPKEYLHNALKIRTSKKCLFSVRVLIQHVDDQPTIQQAVGIALQQNCPEIRKELLLRLSFLEIQRALPRSSFVLNYFHPLFDNKFRRNNRSQKALTLEMSRASRNLYKL